MAEGGEADFVEEYRGYLARFDETLGACEFGAYAKHKGRLIRKLRYEEFAAKWQEFQEVDRAYGEIMERGDTINDVVVRVLRERADELLLERKI
jgi:hypothetical protein